MASTIQVGVLRGVLTADTAEWTSGLRGAGAALSAFENTSKGLTDSVASGMGRAGQAATETAQAGNRAGQALTAVAGILGTINIGQKAAEAAAATSRIQDAAERLKVATEAVQRLAFAAEQSGGSLEGVATAMGRMAETLGSAKADERLRAIGLSLDQIKGLSPDQTFVAIAEAIRAIPDPLRQSDEATNLFGRTALQLLPAIRAGFKDVGDQAPIMSDAVIQSGDRVGDKLQEIELRMNNLKAQALLPLVDVFTTVLPESVQVAVAGFASFMPSLEQLALGVIALGGPSGAWAALLSIGGTVAAFFTTTLPAAFSTTLAFLGPVGWIALALVALVGVWITWGDDIKAFLAPFTDWIAERFGMLRQHALDTWNAIVETARTFFSNLKAVLSKIPSELLLPMLGPIGLVLITFQKWPEIVRIAQAVYTGIKTWMVDKLSAIWDTVKQKIEAVKGYFKGLADAVVLNSYIPDMVQGIGQSIAKLDNVFVKPSELANRLVGIAFENMTRVATAALSDLLRKVTGTFSDIVTNVIPGFAQSGAGAMQKSAQGLVGSFSAAFGAGMGQVVADIAGRALDALANVFTGGEEAKIVNPLRDAFFAKFGGYEGLAKALTAASDGNIADQLLRVLFNADTQQSFEAAVKAIEEVLQGVGRGGDSPAQSQMDTLGASVQGVGELVALLEVNVLGLTTSFTESIAAMAAFVADPLIVRWQEWTTLFTTSVEHQVMLIRDSLLAQWMAWDLAFSQSVYGMAGLLADTFIPQVYGLIDALNAIPRSIDVAITVTRSTVESGPAPGEGLLDGGGGGGFAPWTGDPNSPWATPGGSDPNPTLPSFANEGIVSRPTFAVVGDAKEPEWILRQSSVMGLLAKGMDFGASLMSGLSMPGFPEMAVAGGGSSVGGRGGDVFNLTAHITVQNAGSSPDNLAERLVTALPQALRRDDGLRRKIRGAVR